MKISLIIGTTKEHAEIYTDLLIQRQIEQGITPPNWETVVDFVWNSIQLWNTSKDIFLAPQIHLYSINDTERIVATGKNSYLLNPETALFDNLGGSAYLLPEFWKFNLFR